MASTTGETTKDVLGAPTPRTSSNEDHLSSLAPETLLKILSLASISSFFALTQTSKGFRKFMKSNAALICNDATATRLPLLSACFESKIINKWLVPTHPVFLRCQELCNVPKEEFFRYYLYRYPDSDISELHEKYKYEIDIDSKRMGSDLLRNRGIFVVDMHVKLLIDVTKPGPQFLFFLEEMGEKVMDGWRTPNSKRKSTSMKNNQLTKPDTVLNIRTNTKIMSCMQDFVSQVDMGYGVGLKKDREETARKERSDEEKDRLFWDKKRSLSIAATPFHPRNLAWFYGPQGIPEAHAEGFDAEKVVAKKKASQELIRCTKR